MTVHEFTVEIEGGEFTGDELDALYASGCGDALFGRLGRVQYADFAREAEDYAAAVGSAIRAIGSTAGGRRVTKIVRHIGSVAAAG